ncbi:MAG: STM4014 family protein [Tissierellales bacterium]|jgi:glutathione synthase/RimK-type ligase-like ATP-grasp enzyme|nr:STM4014 family protein [Tissierellales bacterium]
MNINFLLIGDLTGRRMQIFSKCLNHLNLNNITIITWTEILKDISVLESNMKKNTIVKIEPPEKDMEIYRSLLIRGAIKGDLKEDFIRGIDFSDFKIISPRQWYYGFESIVREIKNVCDRYQNQNVYMLNDIDDMLAMMDKEQTYDILKLNSEGKGFYLPKSFKSVCSYEEFSDMYGDKPMKAFIKLRYGSGSTGVLGYANNPRRGQEIIYTSLNSESENFYSNYRVNRFTEKNKVRHLIDWVLKNGAHIESWIPKDKYQGKAFDTRSFVLGGKAEYLLTRMSKTPITNLHLKNERAESCDIMDDDLLEIIKKASESAMEVFSNSLFAGLDVITTNSGRPYIIDVNPFGDLFHNLIGSDLNVHYLEIKKAIEIIRGEKHGS